VADELTPEQQRRLAVDLFNHVWTLLGKSDRTSEENDEMIHAAHASRHHWAEVGTTANLARGEWQVSRVYAMLGRPDAALYHAERCLAYCEASRDVEDWDVPYAYEALARANLVAGNSAEAARLASRARDLAEKVADEEDRELLAADLATLP
jgi:hypothetical protein